jgi:hypothetical protein
LKRATWVADGGWEHVAIWHMYANSRMDELDYPNKKPSEIVILEGDVVGSPLMGAELRSYLTELRYRPYPWDVLALSFRLPGPEIKTRHRFKIGTHASSLPKEAYMSRRGYILTHTGAAKLSRVWQEYDSVEDCLMGEAAAGRLVLLAPGDGRPVIHMSSADKIQANLRIETLGRRRGGHAKGGQGGYGGEGTPWSYGTVAQDRQNPPSPGYVPRM